MISWSGMLGGSGWEREGECGWGEEEEIRGVGEEVRWVRILRSSMATASARAASRQHPDSSSMLRLLRYGAGTALSCGDAIDGDVEIGERRCVLDQ